MSPSATPCAMLAKAHAQHGSKVLCSSTSYPACVLVQQTWSLKAAQGVCMTAGAMGSSSAGSRQHTPHLHLACALRPALAMWAAPISLRPRPLLGRRCAAVLAKSSSRCGVVPVWLSTQLQTVSGLFLSSCCCVHCSEAFPPGHVAAWLTVLQMLS